MPFSPTLGPPAVPTLLGLEFAAEVELPFSTLDGPVDSVSSEWTATAELPDKGNGQLVGWAVLRAWGWTLWQRFKAGNSANDRPQPKHVGC